MNYKRESVIDKRRYSMLNPEAVKGIIPQEKRHYTGNNFMMPAGNNIEVTESGPDSKMIKSKSMPKQETQLQRKLKLVQIRNRKVKR